MLRICLWVLLFFGLAETTFSSVSVILELDGHKIFAEAARTEAEREKGLMYRKTIPPNHGMLFIFSDQTLRYFWMKNTPLPLDIAFIDSHGIIVCIKSMKPYGLTPVSSEKPCKYALEMPVNFFKKIDTHIGDKVKGLLDHPPTGNAQ